MCWAVVVLLQDLRPCTTLDRFGHTVLDYRIHEPQHMGVSQSLTTGAFNSFRSRMHSSVGATGACTHSPARTHAAAQGTLSRHPAHVCSSSRGDCCSGAQAQLFSPNETATPTKLAAGAAWWARKSPTLTNTIRWHPYTLRTVHGDQPQEILYVHLNAPPLLSLMTVMRTGVYTSNTSSACVCSKIHTDPFSTCERVKCMGQRRSHPPHAIEHRNEICNMHKQHTPQSRMFTPCTVARAAMTVTLHACFVCCVKTHSTAVA